MPAWPGRGSLRLDSAFAAYKARERFPAVDGLRAVSIVMVLTWHVNSALWQRLEGWAGVTIFFVISGYLITMLLLREQHREGRVSLRGFWVRRATRILPVYLLVLGFYVALVVGANYHGHRGLLVDVLPFYLSFTNDFAPLVTDTPFAQSWSLGVEEKFYLVWPLVVALWPWRRGWVAAAAALAPLPLLAIGAGGWFHHYAAIMAGCLLAILLEHPRGFRLLAPLARPAGFVAAAAALAAAHVWLWVSEPWAPLVYPFAIAAVMVSLVAGSGPFVWLLSLQWMRQLGRWSYSVYLVHMIVATVVVDALRHIGVGLDTAGRPLGWLWSLAALLAVSAGSFTIAAALYRCVERPWIRRGHRWSEAVIERPRTGYGAAASDRGLGATSPPGASAPG